MNKKEASEIIYKRNKAREVMRKAQKLQWQGKLSDLTINNDKLKQAVEDFNVASERFSEAVRFFLVADKEET
jgi:hypothetical protein